MPSPMPNPSGTPITPTMNPAMQTGISPQQALDAKLVAQSNKTAEMMAKIEMRLSEITSVKQTMQNGAYAAFGNNFITRGAMSLGGMIGDMFGSDEESEETPEKKLAKLMEKQIQVMDLLLIENEIHTKALVDMSDAISQKTLGNSSNRIESIDISDLDDDGNPAAFYNMADQLRGRRPVPDDVTDVDFDESPEPFRWTSEQLKKEMPSDPVEKINIDEILDAPWLKNPPKKTGDVEDVAEKIAPLKIGYSPTPSDSMDDSQRSPKTELAYKPFDTPSDPEDNPRPFKSMADSLMGTPSMKPSDIDGDSAQEHDEEVAKERFFKSVVGLLVKIDKGIEKQNSSIPLSTQESDLESIKKDQSSFVDRINEVLTAFQKASTSTILPEVPSATNEPPAAIKSPDISVGDIDIDVPDGKTNQRPKKTPGKAQKGLKVLTNAARVSRMIPGVGLAIGAGMAAYDGIDGWNSAKDTLGIEGREATTGEKAASALGSVAEGLTFGLIDKQTAARWVAPEKPDQPKQQSMTSAKKQPDVGMAPTTDFNRRGVMFNNDQVAKLDSATDSLRRIENADRLKQPAVASPPVMVNNVNNVNNQTLYAPRRNSNNTESSFNRYISSAFSA